MVTKKNITINWIYNGIIIDDISKTPLNCIGFIYKITNLTNSKYYFGRKTIKSNKKKKLTMKEKALLENKRKTFSCRKITRENRILSSLLSQLRRRILQYDESQFRPTPETVYNSYRKKNG